MTDNIHQWLGKKVTLSFGPAQTTGKLTRIELVEGSDQPGLELDNGPIFRNWTHVQKT